MEQQFSFNRNRLLSVMVVVVVIGLDFATKIWARAALTPGEPLAVTPFFDLALGFNSGVAFGLLNSSGMAFVASVTAIITVVFGIWWVRESNPVARFGLALIIAGAISNLIDRLLHGAVTDFLDLHVAGAHWPAFNLADTSLTVGVLVLLFVAGRRAANGDGSSKTTKRSHETDEVV